MRSVRARTCGGREAGVEMPKEQVIVLGGNSGDVGARGGGGDAHGDSAGCGDQKFPHVKSRPLLNLFLTMSVPAVRHHSYERPVTRRKQNGRQTAGLFVQLDRIYFERADRVIGMSRLR
jgi:hypothetical protein